LYPQGQLVHLVAPLFFVVVAIVMAAVVGDGSIKQGGGYVMRKGKTILVVSTLMIE
jgi:hypothetical protein